MGQEQLTIAQLNDLINNNESLKSLIKNSNDFNKAFNDSSKSNSEFNKSLDKNFDKINKSLESLNKKPFKLEGDVNINSSSFNQLTSSINETNTLLQDEIYQVKYLNNQFYVFEVIFFSVFIIFILYKVLKKFI